MTPSDKPVCVQRGSHCIAAVPMWTSKVIGPLNSRAPNGTAYLVRYEQNVWNIRTRPRSARWPSSKVRLIDISTLSPEKWNRRSTAPLAVSFMINVWVPSSRSLAIIATIAETDLPCADKSRSIPSGCSIQSCTIWVRSISTARVLPDLLKEQRHQTPWHLRTIGSFINQGILPELASWHSQLLSLWVQHFFYRLVRKHRIVQWKTRQLQYSMKPFR